jgi:hypothetical protein
LSAKVRQDINEALIKKEETARTVECGYWRALASHNMEVHGGWKGEKRMEERRKGAHAINR